MRRVLFSMLLLGWVALPASGALMIDPGKSSLTPTSGPVETLSGSLSLKLGAQPPLSGNTTFGVSELTASSSGGLDISLDPSLSNPAAGVLNLSGNFLFPNLFLQLDDGLASFQLTVPNVTGSYGPLFDCPGDVCLETSFQIDTQGPSGIVTVHLYAVPEPATGALLALGCAGLAMLRRREGR